MGGEGVYYTIVIFKERCGTPTRFKQPILQPLDLAARRIFFCKRGRRMRVRSNILDSAALERVVMRIAHEILEKNNGVQDLCLIGVRRRGVPLANMLADNIRRIEGREVPVGELDITLYRDDLTPAQQTRTPVVNAAEIPFDITGKTVVLVDDVLYTGRTVRAAIEALFALGRPAAIRLAILIDRGHRELPLRADYVGKNVPTSHREVIRVRLPEFDDGQMGADLCEREE